MSEETIVRIISPVIIAAYMVWSLIGTILNIFMPVFAPVVFFFMIPEDGWSNFNHPNFWIGGGIFLFYILYLRFDPAMREERERAQAADYSSTDEDDDEEEENRFLSIGGDMDPNKVGSIAYYMWDD